MEAPVKWAGNKAWLFQKHAGLLPAPPTVRRIVLPFCGAGSVGLHYATVPVRLMSDTNAHLITALTVIRDHVEALIEALRTIVEAGYCREQYDFIVERLNTEPGASPVDRAAWVFVVLMWGYNGLWRVNCKGEVNVSFGKPSKPGTIPKLFDGDHLRACSQALRSATLAVMDFEEQVRRAEPGPGDLIYLDPPYVPASETSSFTSYTAAKFTAPARARSDAAQGALFGEEKREPTAQERLAALLPMLDAAGARWALSNSDTEVARALYTHAGWNIVRLTRSGSINSKTTARGAVGEILVRNFT
jgi:DNA adenine methylase